MKVIWTTGRIAALVVVFAGLGACGSVGQIEGGVGKEGGTEIDLSGYQRVVVLDMGDGTKGKDVPDFAGSNFADRIAAEIRSTEAFVEVSRDLGDARSVVISGEITRYAEGNPGLKLVIGFGAGSTYFDAVVRFHDSESDELLGELVVDKNSWVLGGGLAAGQSVEQFMKGAAEKIAKELAEAKGHSGS